MYKTYCKSYESSSYDDPYDPYDYDDYLEELEEYWDWLISYYVYGPGSRSGGGTSVTDNRPEAPKEELVKDLNVKSIDLQIDTNTLLHRTNKYEITDADNDSTPKRPASLVLRRGDFFEVEMKFDRPYDKEKHDMKVCFSFGDVPMKDNKTYFEFALDESGKKKFKPTQWGANLKSRNDSNNSIKVKIHIPANCIVGKWELTVKTYCKGKDKDGKDKMVIFTYDQDIFIFILFNAWCKDDACYMETEKLLEEYVLNDSGLVYQGSPPNSIYGKAWNFGQFELGILEAALYIMQKSYEGFPEKLADPVQVVRGITLMVNACYGGVLVGNWSGKYEGGVKPTKWNGSVKILTQYMEKKEPVRYGQCWVFSALTTTVCRALGLASRSTTNYSSAHDTERSNTIDKFFDKAGKEVSLPDSSDSVWNFHVWNEVWLARHDLQSKRFDGWQAIDATPQELSSEKGDFFYGINVCGPAPVAAIKTGDTDKDFDTDFVFAEVNADVVHWQVNEGGMLSFMGIDERQVGKCMSTKMPDGMPFPPEGYDPESHEYWVATQESREDVTYQYKFPEGTQYERDAVRNAYDKAHFPRPGAYDSPYYQQAVKFTLSANHNVMIGSVLEIKLCAHNESDQPRVISKAMITVYPMMYTGTVGESFFEKEEFSSITLQPGQEETVVIKLTEDDYFKHLFEKNFLLIGAYMEVQETATAEMQHTLKSITFEFDMPGLRIQGPKRNKFGTTIEYTVKVKNPLNIPLTNCVLEGESTAFKKIVTENVPDVPAKGEMAYKIKFDVKKILKKPAHSITFELDADQLFDISDAITAVFSA